MSLNIDNQSPQTGLLNLNLRKNKKKNNNNNNSALSLNNLELSTSNSLMGLLSQLKQHSNQQLINFTSPNNNNNQLFESIPIDNSNKQGNVDIDIFNNDKDNHSIDNNLFSFRNKKVNNLFEDNLGMGTRVLGDNEDKNDIKQSKEINNKQDEIKKKRIRLEEEEKEKLKIIQEQEERKRIEKISKQKQEKLRQQQEEQERQKKLKEQEKIKQNKKFRQSLREHKKEEDIKEEDNEDEDEDKDKHQNESQTFLDNFDQKQSLLNQLDFNFEGVTNDNNININNTTNPNNIELKESLPTTNLPLQITHLNPTSFPSTEQITASLSSLKLSSKQTLSKIIQTLNTFQASSSSPPDNPNSFTFISSFNSNIQTKIFSSQHSIEHKKRLSFINKKYFSGLHNEELPFQNAINSIPTTHLDQLKTIYTEHKRNMFKNINITSTEQLFTKSSMLSPHHPMIPISQLESVETFIHQYSLLQNIKTANKAITLFTHWRYCLNDGNSFYRVVMFNYLQSLIADCNIEYLKQIICEISLDKYKDIFNKYSINIHTVFSVFKGICDLLESNTDKTKAMNVMLNGYTLVKGDFDLAMIVYCRQLCYEYLKMVYDIIRSGNDEEAKGNTINEESVIMLGKEPEFVLILLIPYLFNVNLKIFWIDGAINEHEHNCIDLSNNNIDSLPLIFLGYFFNSYYPLYSNKMKPILNISKTKLLPLRSFTYIERKATTCNTCNAKSNKVYLLQQQCYMCIECLNKHINTVIAKRSSCIYKSKFNGVEYYSQPIHLKGESYITNREFMELYERNDMLNAIHDVVMSSCFSCNEHKGDVNLKVLKCKCRYCDDCLYSKCQKATKGLWALNEYELNTFEKAKCECNEIFNIDEASKYVRGNDREDNITKAKKRMIKYVQTKCICCRSEVRVKEGEEFKDVMEYCVVTVENDNEGGNNSYINYEHVICRKCAEDKTRDMKKNVWQNSLQCEICNKEHFVKFVFDDKLKGSMYSKEGSINERKTLKKTDGACCEVGCFMF